MGDVYLRISLGKVGTKLFSSKNHWNNTIFLQKISNPATEMRYSSQIHDLL